jgi:hypothetical protein
MIYPIVNLNGTSRSELFDLNYEALRVIEKALNTLQKAAPHWSDYPNGDYRGARAEHDERFLKLSHMQSDFTDLCMKLHPNNKSDGG